ncbi:MAG: peptidylprolyl isomerase [Faecousia sp.]
MKKIISIVLAAVLALSAFSGCSAAQDSGTVGENLTPTMFRDITGIEHDEIVMTVGQTEVPAELYFYWVCYVCSSLEYNILNEYSNYGMYGSCVNKETMTINWEGEYAGLPLMDYALSQAESTIKYYMSIEEMAEEKGAALTTNNRVDMENTFRRAVEEMGGEDEFLNYLKMLGISRENFDRISAASYLYMNLLDQVFQPGSDLYLSDEDYNTYATYADHILIATQDIRTGEQLRPEEAVEKYQIAEDLVEQLRASEDPVALFEELADEYSDDPSRADNPTGFIYTAGSMVPEFEATASTLQVGEISDPVQSDYGFHIILRRDLNEALAADESKKVDIAREYLDQQLVKKRSNSQVTYSEALDSVDWTRFYDQYISEVEKISGTAVTAG